MSPWNEEDEAILKKGLKSYHKFNDEKRIGKLFLDLGFRKTSQQIQDRIRELETGTGAGPSGGVTVLQKEVDMLQFLPAPIPNSQNRKGLLAEDEGLENAGAGLSLGLPNPPNPVSETLNVDRKSVEEAAILLDTVARSLSKQTRELADNATKLECVREKLAAFFKK